MSTKQDKAKTDDGKAEYKGPKGSGADFSIQLSHHAMDYHAEAQWIVLRKDDKPKAEMFCTAYTVSGEADRPVTFVFNGGPGASSVYLHMGAFSGLTTHDRRLNGIDAGSHGTRSTADRNDFFTCPAGLCAIGIHS